MSQWPPGVIDCVVDHHIELAETLEGAADRTLDGLLVSNIGLHPIGLATLLANQRCHGLDGLAAAAAQHHPGALGGEQLRGGRTDTGTGSANQRHLIL
ncbi:hypothetical protein D3C80_1671870 [compost metagenome]